MPKVSKKQNYIFDFESSPPDSAYLDPSFLLNILLEDSRYHDALHAQSALVSGTQTIITTDIDFLRVEGLKVYTCNPKV